jgi:PKD repeat protein
MRAFLLAFTLLFILGCKGADNHGIVGSINGPTSIDENTFVTYSVSASSGSEVTYAWAIDPPSAGKFTDQHSASCKFHAVKVIEDTKAEIQVVVVSESMGAVLKSQEIVIRNVLAGGNHPPEASAHVDSAQVAPLTEIQFHDDSSDPDGKGDIVSWEWDFSYSDEDGFTIDSVEQNPHHIYADSGAYLVQLRVTDSGSLSDMLDIPLEITVAVPVSPVAAAHASQVAITQGESVQFTDDSVDSDGTIVKWEWDFSYDASEGFKTESEEREPAHVFPDAGVFAVQLRVTDSSGLSDMLDEPIQITVESARWGRDWGPGEAYDVTVDPDGNVIICGSYEGTVDFDGTPSGTDIRTGEGGYVSKYNSMGDYLWTETFTFDCDDVASDHLGDIFVQGGAESYHLAMIANNDNYKWEQKFERVINEWYDDGENWIYDYIYYDHSGFAVDPQGIVYVVISRVHVYSSSNPLNYTSETNYLKACKRHQQLILDKELYINDLSYWHYYSDLVITPSGDLFFLNVTGDQNIENWSLAKLSTSGSLLWNRQFSGGWIYSGSIASDSDSNVYISLEYSGDLDVDLTSGSHILTSTGENDICLISYTKDGYLKKAGTFGIPKKSGLDSLCVGPTNEVYMTGYICGNVDFDMGPGTAMLLGYNQIFASAYDSDLNYLWVQAWGADGQLYANDIAADSKGDAYVVGSFNGYSDFDPSPGKDVHIAVGDGSAYVNKLLRLH